MLQHKHFGKIRPHRHTSYAALLFVLLLVGVLLAAVSIVADAAVPAVNPQSGSVGLTGTVTAPPPKTGATILSPSNGFSTSTIPVTVSGVCPTSTYVSITKNDVFAGAVSCGEDGTFSLEVDLFVGSNTLVAQVTDALGQNGPDSAGVAVFYNAPSLALPAGSAGKQLFLESSKSVVGGDPGQPILWTVTIIGGVGPYAVEWDWGDGTTTLMSEASEGDVNATHSYKRAGTYRVIVRVTDSAGNSAFMQVITVVNGPISAYGSTKGNGLGALPGNLVGAWPLFIIAFLMVAFFWLGQRLEVRKLRRQNRLLRA